MLLKNNFVPSNKYKDTSHNFLGRVFIYIPCYILLVIKIFFCGIRCGTEFSNAIKRIQVKLTEALIIQRVLLFLQNRLKS